MGWDFFIYLLLYSLINILCYMFILLFISRFVWKMLFLIRHFLFVLLLTPTIYYHFNYLIRQQRKHGNLVLRLSISIHLKTSIFPLIMEALCVQLNFSIPWLGIETTTCRVYSLTFAHLRHDWPHKTTYIRKKRETRKNRKKKHLKFKIITL